LVVQRKGEAARGENLSLILRTAFIVNYVT